PAQPFCRIQRRAAVEVLRVYIDTQFDGDLDRLQSEVFPLAAFDFNPWGSASAHSGGGHHGSRRFFPLFPGDAAAFHHSLGTKDEQWISAVLDEKAHDFRFGESGREPEWRGTNQFRREIEI